MKNLTHPISELEHQLNKRLQEQGFMIVNTTDLASIHDNFDVLNVHSMFDARDYRDVFSVTETQILKKHNTGFEYKALSLFGAPLKIAFLGRSYRNIIETPENDIITFQYEGVIADEGISFVIGKKLIDFLVSDILPDTSTRIISKFFPYVEPGYMLQIPCSKFSGEGSESCFQLSYVNACAFGMLHPNIIEYALGKSNNIRAFSFCFNLSQIACVKNKLSDIHDIFFNY